MGNFYLLNSLSQKITLLILISIGFSSLHVSADDLVVREKSENGIVFEFNPRNWEINTEVINDKFYYKIKFDNCSYQTSNGKPLVPVRNAMVGIPFNAQVTVEILELDKKRHLNGKLIPVPTFGSDSMDQLQYWEDPVIYQSQQGFPNLLVKVSLPSVMRNQQVVMISLYPIQFFPVEESIQLYGRIVVRINFFNGDQDQKASNRFDNAFIYNQVLLNADQAAKWRKYPIQSTLSTLKKLNLGECYKIWIREEGLYKITGAELKEAGVNLRDIKPYRIKMFNNGGFQLPQNINEDRTGSLIENAISVSDGGDGSFDSQDYILFYGKSVKGWKYDRNEKLFSHYINPYTKENVYWFCWQDPDSGKRMEQRTIIPSKNVSSMTSFYDHIYVENEYQNLLNSGTIWLGNYFSAVTSQRNYMFDLRGALPEEKGVVKVQLAGASYGEHRFSLYLNDSFMAQVPTFSGNVNIRIKQFSTPINTGLKDGYNRLTVEYIPSSDVSLAYMDWIELSVHRQLKAQDDQLLFYSPDSAGFYHYHLDDFSSDDIQIFDITQFYDVTQLNISKIVNETVEFIDSTNSDVPKKYLAIAPNRFKSPVRIERDMPSELRNTQNGADFIVITFDDFYDAALALKSLRENCDTLTTQVVKISDVYDEFSWGLVDPVAIRDFIKYAYDNWSKQPRYVLLFGDGDYDYKNIISPHDPNWIPPYETADLDKSSSRARDDWYVCVAGNDNLMDLAISRIPVRNPDQALDVVKKIIDYENSPVFGEWCNTITMVADDEYGQGGGYDVIDHIRDAEDIAEQLIPRNYNVQKIYLTEYPAIHDASISGIRKPAAHEDLIKKINQGSLIINFIGHGHEKLWTHERVLVLSDDLPRINNGSKQAFWIAATCNFARYDNPDFQSFAEELVTLPNQGAIAVFSSSRYAEANDNVSLNRALYQSLFNELNIKVRLGDVIMVAKNSRGNFINDQFYHLLGDPTLRLAMPTCSVRITEYTPDSMKALSRMEVKGNIQSLESPSSQLKGQILFKAFDSRKHRTYRVNPWKEWNYKLPGNIMFRGIATVTNGQFKTQFIVPKDITYGGREGKFDAFYWDEQRFGSGYLDGLYVGGTQTEFYDTEGPIISIGFEGQEFISGGFVPSDPTLKMTIADNVSGVNIAGDIGHTITMMLDEAQDKKIELNDYFQYEQDNYLVGHITYPLKTLSEGTHQILVKAWDNCNNSSQIAAEFTVVSLDRLIIRDLFNYPNPFSDYTEFTFWVNQDCDVEIKIYTLAGRLICKLDQLKAETGFNHFLWNGRDQDGEVLANGVYLYKVFANCFDGKQKIHAEHVEKCVVMR